jgi:ABC-type nitrate/sulfonate/bicarbonate transport system ATPase subunit
MDEPLAALDAARKAESLPAIERLHVLSGIAIVDVNHAIAEVARLADHAGHPARLDAADVALWTRDAALPLGHRIRLD